MYLLYLMPAGLRPSPVPLPHMQCTHASSVQCLLVINMDGRRRGRGEEGFVARQTPRLSPIRRPVRHSPPSLYAAIVLSATACEHHRAPYTLCGREHTPPPYLPLTCARRAHRTLLCLVLSYAVVVMPFFVAAAIAPTLTVTQQQRHIDLALFFAADVAFATAIIISVANTAMDKHLPSLCLPSLYAGRFSPSRNISPLLRLTRY